MYKKFCFCKHVFTNLAIIDMGDISDLDKFFKVVANVFKYPSCCVYANICGFSSC